jgi:hypothetical protein
LYNEYAQNQVAVFGEETISNHCFKLLFEIFCQEMNRSSETLGQINFFASITGRSGRMSLIFEDESHVSRNIFWRCKPRLEFNVSWFPLRIWSLAFPVSCMK